MTSAVNKARVPAIFPWKYLAAMWAWPFIFFSTLVFPGFDRHPRLVFFGVHFPVMGICFYIATMPMRRGQLTLLQTAWWAVGVPFLIWGIMIFGVFGLVASFK